MGHTVGDAAANAVKKSERKAAAEQTPEEMIDALRKNYRANLYIPMHQIGALLTKYDLDRALMIQNTSSLALATKTIQELDAEKVIALETILGLTQNVQDLLAKLAQYEDVSTADALNGHDIQP